MKNNTKERARKRNMNFGKTIIMLEKSCNDPKVFWNIWKGFTEDVKTNLGTKFNGDKWYTHFSNLHTAGAVDITKPGDNTQYQSPGSQQNSPFY